MNKHDRLSILLVEDDEETRKILAEVLALAFPELLVHSADNGKTGLECFRQFSSAIVISDINMPVMDGISMAREIKAINADVKLIILTAFSDKRILTDTAATEINIDHYIPKPTDYGKLFTAIEQCLTEIAPAGVLTDLPLSDNENPEDPTTVQNSEETENGAELESAAIADFNKPAPFPTNATMRVLVVEDDRLARETTGSLLESYGYEVQLADSGQNALTQFESFRPQAVLMDIELPDLNGYELARNVRNLPGGADVLLVAISGHGRTEDLAQAKQAGFDHHLVKPFIFAPLRELLSQRARSMMQS